MKVTRALGLAVLSMVALCGCAQYQYRVVEPAAAAGPIGKEPRMVPSPPLEYALAREGDHLILRVSNPSDQPVAIVPSRSYVVDPRGESHPFPSRVIAPHSHINLTLPPYPATVTGYGFGGYPWYGAYGWYGPPYWPAYGWGWGAPLSYTYTYQLLTPYDWVWKTGLVRLHLGFHSAGKDFAQELVLDREKVQK